MSYLTKDEQINLYGNQMAACQCYVARKAGPSGDHGSGLEQASGSDQ